MCEYVVFELVNESNLNLIRRALKVTIKVKYRTFHWKKHSL